jgi:hypothetical protein
MRGVALRACSIPTRSIRKRLGSVARAVTACVGHTFRVLLVLQVDNLLSYYRLVNS